VNPAVYAYFQTGTFIVTSSAQYRVCQPTSISGKITVVAKPEIDLGADTTICEGSAPIIFVDYINAGNPNASWKWNTGATTSSIQVNTPGYYAATVSVNNCEATDSVWVASDCYITLPNIFTPNADGINDYFCPRQFVQGGLITFKMDIYNRWGQIIFETTNIEGRGWDGKLNNAEQPEGVYMYVVDATFKNGRKEHRQGNITLLR
jgi:gliding motility-associated-like protein